nr:hypothetical protein [Tanacetum cinerariifolium]
MDPCRSGSRRFLQFDRVFVGIISKGKRVEVIIIFDDDIKDDALLVGDYEDEAFFVSNSEDDSFSVSDYEDVKSEVDDDTNVMWVVPDVHASTSKVSKFKEQKGGIKKNSSEVNKPTSKFKRPYSEVRITNYILGLRAHRSVVGCSSSKKGVVGCSSSKKGAVGCSSTKQRK